MLNRGIGKNPYIATIMTKVLIVVFGFANSVFSTRFLGAGLKGHYSYILNVVIMLSLLLDFGVYKGYPAFKKQKVEGLTEKFVQFFKLQFFVVLVITIVLYIRFDVEYKYFLFLLPLQVIDKQIDFITLIEDIHARNMSRVIANSFYTTVLIAIYFIVAEPDLIYIFAIVVIKTFIEVGLKIKALNLKIFHLHEKTDYPFLWKSLKIGFLPMLTMLLVASNYRIDVIILKQLVSFEEIGIYTLAVNLGSQIWLIPDAFKDVLFNKNARKDNTEAIIMSIKFNFLLSIVIVIGFIILGKPFIRLLYAEEFVGAYVPLAIILVGNIFMIFYKFIYTIFMSNNERLLPIIIFTITVLINIGFNYLFIPLYGINGAAIASLISYSFCGIGLLVAFINKYNVNPKELVIGKSDFLFYYDSIKAKIK